MSKKKILFFDIETSLMKAYTFGLGDQYLTHEDIMPDGDWHLMAFAAKWLGDKKVVYHDQRESRSLRNDKKLAKTLRDLINEADVIVSQNGVGFDLPRLNARLEQHDEELPKRVDHVDVLKIKRKVYAFTSNRLAYTSSILNKKYQKLSHKKFPGKDLWKQCEAGNEEAWEEMKLYNIYDVLSLEEEYIRLAPKDTSVDRASEAGNCRVCDGSNLQSRGFEITGAGRYRRYQCQDCGAWMKGSKNEMPKEERQERLRKI